MMPNLQEGKQPAPEKWLGDVQARGQREQRAWGRKEFPEAGPGSDGKLDRGHPTCQTRLAGVPDASLGSARRLWGRSPSQLRTRLVENKPGLNLREISSILTGV